MLVLYILSLFLSQITVSGFIIPITKSDGSLDISSLLSHVTLLEQKMEGKASSDVVNNLEAQLAATQSDFKVSQGKLETAQEELKEVRSELKSTQIEVAVLKSKLETQILNNGTSGGVTYTRWGRTTCPAGTKKVYKGYTGGSWYSDAGGSATTLCLPEQPLYGNHTDAHHSYTSHIYGTEYEELYTGAPFTPLNDDDVPCIVCESSSKAMVVMIPARNICYQGWTLEYTGYLMAGLPSEASTDYICVDQEAEALPGGGANENGHVLYPVESQCGALACPPYENDWELTCVVCSK